MNEKLLIAKKTKKTIEYIVNLTDNYPHKYIELKSRIINTSFDILEMIYLSNIDNSNKKYIISKLKMLDYYFKLSYKKEIISKRKYEVISNYLLEIVKMMIGWSNEKSR